jgi:hypothetical protein
VAYAGDVSLIKLHWNIQLNIILHLIHQNITLPYGGDNNSVLNMNGLDIKSETKGPHLGHIIGSNINSDVIRDSSDSFTRRVLMSMPF